MIDRRRFVAGGAASVAVLAAAGCGGGGGGGGSVAVVPVALTPPSPAPSPTPTPAPVPPTTRLILWGDSRTEGIGAVGREVFPERLAARFPAIAVVGAGRSGQTAAQIVARQGGAPALATLADNVIPVDGVARVTALSVDIFFYAGVASAAGLIAGSLAGVEGTLSSDGAGGLAFTRSSPGERIVLGGPTAFVTALGSGVRAATMFLCVGRNGIETEDPAATIAAIDSAIGYLDTSDRRIMIADVMPDLDAPAGSVLRRPFDALNTLIRARYGADRLDLATPPSAAELAAIGYAATAEEQGDIAAGVYPRGMFVEPIHLNAAGQAIWASRVAARMVARGWGT